MSDIPSIEPLPNESLVPSGLAKELATAFIKDNGNKLAISLGLLVIATALTSIYTVVLSLLMLAVGYIWASPQISSSQCIIALGDRVFGKVALPTDKDTNKLTKVFDENYIHHSKTYTIKSVKIRDPFNTLVDYIIRDFIDFWYKNLNHSGGKEFQNHIRNALNGVACNLAHYAVLRDINMVILSSFGISNVAILHLREYRRFEMSTLSLTDYLFEHPTSSFNQTYSTRHKVEALKRICQLLFERLLPPEDRGSPVVFSLLKEMISSVVLLPLVDMVADPDFINQQIVSLLKNQLPSENDIVLQGNNNEIVQENELLHVRVIEARQLPDLTGANALFCNILCGESCQKTKRISPETNPIWNELFKFTWNSELNEKERATLSIDGIVVDLIQKQMLSEYIIGSVYIPRKAIKLENTKQWFSLESDSSTTPSNAQIYLEISLKNKTKSLKSNESNENSIGDNVPAIVSVSEDFGTSQKSDLSDNRNQPSNLEPPSQPSSGDIPLPSIVSEKLEITPKLALDVNYLPPTSQMTIEALLKNKDTYQVVFEYMKQIGKENYIYCWKQLNKHAKLMANAEPELIQRGVMDIYIEFFTPGCAEYVDFDHSIILEWKNAAMLNPSPELFNVLQQKVSDYLQNNFMFGFKRSMLFEKVVQIEMGKMKKLTSSNFSLNSSSKKENKINEPTSKSLNELNTEKHQEEKSIEIVEPYKPKQIEAGKKSNSKVSHQDDALSFLQREMEDLDEMIQSAGDEELRDSLITTKEDLEREIQEYERMLSEVKSSHHGFNVYGAKINVVQVSTSKSNGKASKALATAFGMNNEPTTLYMIEIEADQSGWMVTKRYSEFYEFHQSLKQEVGAPLMSHIKFPSRNLFKSNDGTLLTKYMLSIVSDRALADSSSVKSFVKPANYQPSAKKNLQKLGAEIMKSAVNKLKPFKSSDNKGKGKGITSFFSSKKPPKVETNDTEEDITEKDEPKSEVGRVIDTSFIKMAISTEPNNERTEENVPALTSGGLVSPSGNIYSSDDDGDHRGRRKSLSFFHRRPSRSVEFQKSPSLSHQRRSSGPNSGSPPFSASGWKADFDLPSPLENPSAEERPENESPSEKHVFKIQEIRELTDEEVELMLEALFALVEEMFLDDLQRSQWLRRKALNIIRQLLRQSFGSAINSVFTQKILSVLTEDTGLLLVQAITSSCWPKGTWPLPEEKPPLRTESEREATKLEAKTLLLNVMPDSLQRVLGYSNCTAGLTRLFNLLQHKELNFDLVLGILERLVKLIFAEKVSMEDF